MAEEAEEEEVAPKKGKKGLLIGLVLALVLGAGGFYAVFSGMILGGGDAEAHAAEGDSGEDHAEGGADAEEEEPVAVAFVPIEPLVVSLTGINASRHLRFRAQLETTETDLPDVEHLMPRVVDVMNAYLRAVDPAALDRPGALIDVRAQLLRRVALVVGPNKVRDVLVMEFVLS